MDFNTALQLQIEGYPGRLKSYLVGKEEGNYLLIKIPLLKAPEKLFRQGKELIIRYVYQGSAFGFRTQVILPLFDSFNVVFVGFPKRIEDFNLRVHKRFECSLPARLEVITKHQNRQMRFKTMVNDISKGGCRLTISLKELEWSKDPIKIKAEVSLFLSLPGVDGELFLQAAVRSLSQDEDAMALGLQFIGLEGKDRVQLDRFLAVHQS
ncbi:MAG: flagellar brake protein [Deltaproteobacteria bacterium]|nr:flagellar brake protein [Deltaproteobacteria bacterium]